MLIDPLGTQRKIDPDLVQLVKDWVREALHLGDDTTLMVTELRCTEPDCPPVETVIALMEITQPGRQYKMHKPLAQITRDDIAQLAITPPKHIGSTQGPQEKETDV